MKAQSEISGDGWANCLCGERHWGVYGAAGIALIHSAPGEEYYILLDRRAPGTHMSGTWSIPGGAKKFGESSEVAAYRELFEEVSTAQRLTFVSKASIVYECDQRQVLPEGSRWSYTTLVALMLNKDRVVASSASWESSGVMWYPFSQVSKLELHPGFAASWGEIRASIER